MYDSIGLIWPLSFQVFDGIHTIQFLVACNTFDQFLPEDPNINRLQESINLFQDVWSSRWYDES
jgi:hypothetical protein